MVVISAVECYSSTARGGPLPRSIGLCPRVCWGRTMRKLRVYLADDHQVLREGLKLLVDSQPDMEVVGEASNGREARRGAAACHPDVLVLDVAMPEVSGAQAAETIKQHVPDVKVLALTRHAESSYVRQLLTAGADGYILKRAAANELIQAIRTVAAGGTYLDPEVAGNVVGGFVGKTSREAPPGSQLTTREAEVLQLAVLGHVNKEIAAQLNISVKTVETHKSNGMDKLGLRTRAELVRYGIGAGWLRES